MTDVAGPMYQLCTAGSWRSAHPFCVLMVNSVGISSLPFTRSARAVIGELEVTRSREVRTLNSPEIGPLLVWNVTMLPLKDCAQLVSSCGQGWGLGR